MATKMTQEEIMMQLLASMNANNEKLNAQQMEVLKSTKTVKVKNLMPFGISFTTSKNPYGYILEGNQINSQLTVAEVEEQVNMGNVAFTGVDGHGNHATLQILDTDVREMLLGDSEKYLLTEEEMQRLLEIRTPAEFQSELDKCVIKHSEARALAHYAFAKFGEANLFGWQQAAIDAKIKSV